MANSESILTMQDLTFCYDGHSAAPVLQDINLNIASGQRVGLVGCNGVGKSTLLKLLVGILPMQQGTLEVAGLAMQRENLASIRRKVGYIFQDSDSQLFMPTVAADVAFGWRRTTVTRPRRWPPAPSRLAAGAQSRIAPIGRCHRLSGWAEKLASIAGS